jgi:DNA-directed RNA polymerase subunit RPC12/RpoP
LAAGDEQIVLRAMQQTFVEHGLCLREPTDTGTVLVFPSYFRRERPEQAGHPALLVSYDLSGALDEIYATLVVRLHHTTAFRRRQLWRFAADFETQANKLIGFSLHKAAEGRGEFAIYSDASVSEEEKALFIRYIHEHLTSRADHCTRRRHYACYSCGSQVIDRRAVERRLARGEKDIVCSDCEGRVQLWDLIEEKFGSNELAKQVVALERTARKGIDWDGQRLKMAAEVYSVAREAGLMFRQYPRPESGIHGEIEMPELAGRPWKARLFVVIVGQDNLEAREGWLRYGKDWERRGYVRMVYDVSGMMYWTDVGIGRSEVPAGVIAGPEELGGAPMTTLSLLAIRDKLSRRRPHTPETDSGKPGPIRLPHHSLLPEDQSLRHKRLDGENEAGIASAAALPKGAGATVTNRIRVIFLAADPTDAARLRLGAEVRHIQEKLQLARLRDRITLDQRMAVRTQDLSQSLLDTTPQIVHFSGHGTVDGALCFESEDGSAHPVPPEALASLFREFTDCVQCVVLNACYSDEQARAIAAHIPFVIGMSAAISDSAAIAFAIGFYQGLGAGRSIPQAFQLGVAQIRLQGVPEHLTPILASRGSRDPNGAEEGTPGA